MDKKRIISQTITFVKQQLKGDATGHDWWHVHRVWHMALILAEQEGADLFVVQLATLLHDIADWKFHAGDDKKGEVIARQWLESLGLEEKVISHVCQIVSDISFKGAGVATHMKTIEGKVVQDADRLDAIGAIGIARAFAYGGYKKREMYNPEIEPLLHQSFEQYKNSEGTTVNHFHEKLLLLKNRMNTQSALQIAEERHQFMEVFLDEFLKECDT